MLKIRSAIALLGMLLLAACADSVAPTAPVLEAPQGAVSAARGGAKAGLRAPDFVRRRPGTPHISRERVRLVATAGRAAEATLRFEDGTPFAHFRLPAEALEGATLNGRRIRRGERVEITLQRQNAVHFVVDMQPSGLVFNADAPADVTFFYQYADLRGTERLEAWKQERPGDPWQRTAHQDDRRSRAFRARVDDFTIYAMAIP